MASTLLSDIKTDLGITSTAKEVVIQSAIDSALTELYQAGIDTENLTSDSYLNAAIRMYCRAEMNFQGLTDLWRKRFEEMKKVMARTEAYEEVVIPDAIQQLPIL